MDFTRAGATGEALSWEEVEKWMAMEALPDGGCTPLSPNISSPIRSP